MPRSKTTKKSCMEIFERPSGAFVTASAAEYAQSTPSVGRLLQEQQRHRAELRKRRKDRTLTSSDSPDEPVRRTLRRRVAAHDEELSPDDSVIQVQRRKPAEPARGPTVTEATLLEYLTGPWQPKSVRKAIKPLRPTEPEPRQKESSDRHGVDHIRGKLRERVQQNPRWTRGDVHVKSRKQVHADGPSVTSTSPSSSSAEAPPRWLDTRRRELLANQRRQPTATKELTDLRSKADHQVRTIERLNRQLERAQEEIDDRDAAIERFKAKASCAKSLWEDMVSLVL